ncbi:MAG: hypothetical protein BAJATHORv1_140001, partial [Candidatus Thorarchaeota archaeon]
MGFVSCSTSTVSVTSESSPSRWARWMERALPGRRISSSRPSRPMVSAGRWGRRSVAGGPSHDPSRHRGDRGLQVQHRHRGPDGGAERAGRPSSLPRGDRGAGGGGAHLRPPAGPLRAPPGRGDLGTAGGRLQRPPAAVAGVGRGADRPGGGDPGGPGRRSRPGPDDSAGGYDGRANPPAGPGASDRAGSEERRNHRILSVSSVPSSSIPPNASLMARSSFW